VGIAANIPAGLKWQSSNENVATINEAGLENGIAAGQTEITARLNDASTISFLLVVEDENQLTSLIISPSNTQIINSNETVQLSSTGKSLAGNTLQNLALSWKSNLTEIIQELLLFHKNK